MGKACVTRIPDSPAARLGQSPLPSPLLFPVGVLKGRAWASKLPVPLLSSSDSLAFSFLVRFLLTTGGALAATLTLGPSPLVPTHLPQGTCSGP